MELCGMITKKEEDKLALVKDVVRLYNKSRRQYKLIARFLEEKLLPELFPEAQKYSARTKTPESIVGKILKKYLKKNAEASDIYKKFTDLIGTRVIFLRRDEVEKADTIVRDNFTVDDRNSQNTADRLNDREFGYQSRHYIVKIDQTWLNEHGWVKWSTKGAKKITGDIFVELQIRTWLQHVWDDLSHDSIYKGDRVIPCELMRSWNALAAILENVDEDIVRCLDQLDNYRKNSPYYVKDELDKKIKILEMITRVQCDKLEDTDSYACDQEEKSKTEVQLKKRRDELYRLYQIRGDKNFPLIGKIDTVLGNNSEPPWEDPTAPKNLLVALLENMIPNKDNDSFLAPRLESSLRRCEEMICTSSDLPWAFAGKAFFLMLLLDSEKRELKSKNVNEIYDAILRLIDLCNERSVANLDKARIIATPEAKEALKRLYNSIANAQFKQLCKSIDGTAPITDCAIKMLELGAFAHGIVLHEDEGMAKPPEKSQGTAVLIAGGCKSIHNTSELKEFKTFFCEALQGTERIDFYTGEGTSGICGLCFGRKNSVTKIGSEYKTHSIYEALLEWEAVRKGYRFDDVALVGFGLGEISRMECKIALALGARVTVIGHRKFLSYQQSFEGIPYWSSHPSLIRLPLIREDKPKNLSFENSKIKKYKDFSEKWFPEPMMLRVFMLFKPYHEGAYKSIDLLVHLIHRIKQLRTVSKLEDLKEDFKGFSAQHRLYSFEKLYKDAKKNESLEKLKQEVAKLLTKNISFPNRLSKRSELKEWLDKMHNEIVSIIDYDFGEREHARWYIERWLQGTRYGDNKIDRNVPKDQVKNPCMVAWFDLDDDTIIKDIEFLNRYLVANYILNDCQDAKEAIEKCFADEKD